MSMAIVEIMGGICGHLTTAQAVSEDGQMATFAIETGCPNIGKLSDILAAHAPIDAFEELRPGGGMIAQSAREAKSVCAGCVVPAALAKTLQVATGLALPKDPTVKITKG
jgi:hypothetical protein